MKFVKENSYDIVKLIINQIGITIFSLVLLFTANGANLPPVFKPLFSVFSTLFYFALLYTVAWEFGAKDKIKIDSGRYSATKAKGLFLGLWANCVNIFLAILNIENHQKRYK
jgi:FtsH-binding integral membrane protein